MDFLEYADVSCEHRGSMQSGKLKLTDEKVQFKPHAKSGKSDLIPPDQIEVVNWQRLAGSWGIRIFTKDGLLHRFAGFKEAERERLAKFFTQYYKLDLLDRELSVKGWNWGAANFNGSALSFEVGKSDSYEIPLAYVNQCNHGKNEVTLEFHHNDDAPVMLCEMRFHIPASELAGDDPVEAFKEQVLNKASVVTTSGDAIAIFREIHCLSPRGRYDVKIFPSHIHLHGKTFDYKISSTSVMRLFLLPHKDQRQMYFAVNCDPPIKQGQTRYHYLVLNFKQEDESEIELPFTDEELQEKYDGKLERELNGPTYEILSKILKALTNKKVIVPGNFLGHSGTPAISCSHKAASGFLYPLERGFIFVYKPPIYIRYDEVRSVSFERSGGSTRSFDISVDAGSDIMYTFSSIEKGEYSRLYDYLKDKKVKLKTSGKVGEKSGLNFDDETIDHNLEKVKADAQEFSSGDDSMSSDDSDFNPDNLEALSAKEEYDSEPSTTSGDSSSGDEQGEVADKRREERKKRKEEKRGKREKKSVSSGGGEKKKRKQTRTKLPGEPKRNQSAYFLWMNANRERVKEENPSLNLTELGKKFGEIWKTMEDKSEWDKKAAEDKKRYDDELAKWKAEGGNELLANQKKERRKEKRAAKAGTAKPGSKSSSKPKSSSAAASSATSPAKPPGGFKSKEFIEDSDSSSDAGD